MNCPCKAFKRKLLLVSLAILASLLTLPHAYAMEEDEGSVTEIEGDEQSGKRPADSELGVDAEKRPRMDGYQPMMSQPVYGAPQNGGFSQQPSLSGSGHNVQIGNRPNIRIDLTTTHNGQNNLSPLQLQQQRLYWEQQFLPQQSQQQQGQGPQKGSQALIPSKASMMPSVQNNRQSQNHNGTLAINQNNVYQHVQQGQQVLQNHEYRIQQLQQQVYHMQQFLPQPNPAPQQPPVVQNEVRNNAQSSVFVVQPRTVDQIQALIVQAKNGDRKIQDELIELCTSGLYMKLLTPTALGFVDWEKIVERCENNPHYTRYILQFPPILKEKLGHLSQLLKSRAENLCAHSQFNLYLMHSKGYGMEKDLNEALRYLNLAANQEFPKALESLGRIYQGKVPAFKNIVEQDSEKSFSNTKLAADKKYACAQFSLGEMYYLGDGVKKDLNEACRLYALAAHQGHAAALTRLSLEYLKGDGVGKDTKEAYRLCKLAADQEWPEALYGLAQLYANGIGVERSDTKATHYLKLAVDKGHQPAQNKLAIPLANENPLLIKAIG